MAANLSPTIIGETIVLPIFLVLTWTALRKKCFPMISNRPWPVIIGLMMAVSYLTRSGQIILIGIVCVNSNRNQANYPSCNNPVSYYGSSRWLGRSTASCQFHVTDNDHQSSGHYAAFSGLIDRTGVKAFALLMVSPCLIPDICLIPDTI